MEKVGRNAPCPCGSGRKYKRCHGAEGAELSGGPAATAATQLANQLFEIGRGMAESLLKKLRGVPVRGNLEYKRAMLFFFAKAYKTYQAAELLWNSGYGEDAYLLTRAIYEIRLQVLFMSRDPTKRSKDFMDHLLKSAFGTLQLLWRRGRKDWQSGLDLGEADIREAANLTGRIDLLKDAESAERSIKQKWWGGGGIKRLVTDLQLDAEYDWVYAFLSDYEHSGARILTEYVRLSEEAPTTLVCYPAKTDSLTVPWSVTDWLLQIAGLTGRAFDFDLDEAVVNAQKRAKDLLSAYRQKKQKG
jgi:hypothetical protein